MKTILLPTDFSDNARHSFLYAATLFGKEDVKYVMMNAYDIPKRSAEVMVATIKDGIGSESKQELDKEMEWFHKETQIPWSNLESLVSMGSVTDAVNNFVHDKRTDFIVMGTKGAAGLKEVFIGSNTYSVIKKVNIPVIALPAQAQRTAPRSITLSLDMKFPVDQERFEPLTHLAKTHGSKITILTIHPEKEERDFTAFKNELRDTLGDLFHKFVYKRSDQVADSIENYARLEHPDLLCLLPNRSSFFERLFSGSVTQKIAFHSKVPLLALP